MVKKSSSKKKNMEKKQVNKKKKNKIKTLVVPTNDKPKLVELELTRSHNFLSSTNSTHTTIYPMKQDEGQRYFVSNKPSSYSTILKLILKIQQTNDMNFDWSLILWDITQKEKLDNDIDITCVSTFEKKDDKQAEKDILGRRRSSNLTSGKDENKKRISKSVQHDRDLLHSLDKGEGVMCFGAEMIITASTEEKLEQAVTDISNYLKVNQETNGLYWAMDINKQSFPYTTHGPNKVSANKDMYFEMTTDDACVTSLVVDSGGNRDMGSEYMGLSIGKLIQSHAAYKFINKKSLFIGNDTLNKTHTRTKEFDEPSEIYLSKVASRAHLLSNKKVTHFIINKSVKPENLMNFKINDDRKVYVDVSKGYLNILEAINPLGVENFGPRLIPFFNTHLNNIITLLSQFRKGGKVDLTDAFSNATKEILISYFIENKNWRARPEEHIDDLRLFGEHSGFKKIDEFSQFVTNAKTNAVNNSVDNEYTEAIKELDNILVNNILYTIPALNVKTDNIIDDLIKAQYKVVDLSTMSVGAISNNINSALNVMLLAYLNIILPSCENGDVIMLHGLSQVSDLAKFIIRAIESSGKDINIVFTESNQTHTSDLLNLLTYDDNNYLPDIDRKTRVSNDFNFVVLDLYSNDVDKLSTFLDLDMNWASSLKYTKSMYFVQTNRSSDYIAMDDIL